jgi:hypothetical protein
MDRTTGSVYAASASLAIFLPAGCATSDQGPPLSYWRKSCWRTDCHMSLALCGGVVVVSVHPDGDENVRGLNLSTGGSGFSTTEPLIL